MRRTRNRIRYEHFLAWNADLVVQMTVDRGRLARYSVVLRFYQDERWRPVQLFDNAHDVHETHRYTGQGEKLPAQKLSDGTPQEGLDAALSHLTERWERILEEWLR